MLAFQRGRSFFFLWGERPISPESPKGFSGVALPSGAKTWLLQARKACFPKGPFLFLFYGAYAPSARKALRAFRAWPCRPGRKRGPAVQGEAHAFWCGKPTFPKVKFPNAAAPLDKEIHKTIISIKIIRILIVSLQLC